MILERLDRKTAVFYTLDLCAHFAQNLDRDLRIDLVVLGHEDAAALEGVIITLFCRFARRFRRLGGLLRHRQMQEHGEIRALARRTVHDDLAAHQTHELIGDRHAEAGAAEFSARLDALLLERTENTVQKGVIHADTGIVNAEHEVRDVILKHHLTERDDDLALARELDSVREEVDDDLADAQLVADDTVDRHILQIDLVADAARLKLLGEHIIQTIAQTAQAEHLVLKLDLSGLDARHIQNVIDEREQMSGHLVRLVQILHRLVSGAQSALCERDHADDAVHRGSDLVRHAREEGCFRAALLLRPCEALFAFLDAVVQCSDVAEAQQVVLTVGRAADDEAHPASAAALYILIEHFSAVPRHVFFPDRTTSAFVRKSGIEISDIIPQRRI